MGALPQKKCRLGGTPRRTKGSSLELVMCATPLFKDEGVHHYPLKVRWTITSRDHEVVVAALRG